MTSILTLVTTGPVATLGPDWLNAEYLINAFGTYALIGVVVVVFIETGLFFPFLPGDSLLFTAGALVAQDQLQFPLWLLCLLVATAAFAGDQNAYWIGRRIGPRLFSRPDSRIFKREYVDETYRYFDKYGGGTIIVARFVPIVRTYSAAAAGIGRMKYSKFVTFDLIGAVLWGVGVTVLGYLLGNIPFVKNNIEYLLVAIVAASVVPVAIGWWRARRAAKAGTEVDPALARYEDPAERARVERKTWPDVEDAMNREVNAWLTDMDGVLVHEGTALPGAAEFVHALRDAELPFLVLTNNSIYTPRDLRARLAATGIEVPEQAIWTSALATATFLAEQVPGGSAYAIGEAGLTTALHEAGYTLTDSDPDYVVLGETRTYSFEALTNAIRLVQNGSRFIATNPDVTGPTADGDVPATGAVAAMIKAATGRNPYFVGKPNPMMFRSALNRIDAHSETTAMIGDRMDTDVVAGIEAGLQTYLVLSGSTTRAEVDRFPFRPMHVVDSIADLVGLVRRS